jgi:PTS system glucitol/sorbitol-specific IIC component
MENVLAYLSRGAEWFINLFTLGGRNFMDLVTGIVPTLIVLITFVNALISIIGQERVNGFARRCSRFRLLRYTVLPLLSMFVLCNPLAYTFGRFLDEKYKPAFYDAAVSLCHPITGLFPHANPGELFVYLGIASGIEALGYSLGPLALRYFIVGMIVVLLRGLVTERITALFMRKRGA